MCRGVNRKIEKGSESDRKNDTEGDMKNEIIRRKKKTKIRPRLKEEQKMIC